ncbi:photosystem II reaction center protein PsbN [Anthocerotibacter panamensis]|nr:photosystem II reaction center protein PsbN [Anthocerotibacter panamensis]
MIPAQALIISIAVVLVGITAYSVYVAFGPPSKDLEDPYEMHED